MVLDVLAIGLVVVADSTEVDLVERLAKRLVAEAGVCLVVAAFKKKFNYF